MSKPNTIATGERPEVWRGYSADPENLEIGQLRRQALKLGLASELSQLEEAAASGKNADELDLNP